MSAAEENDDGMTASFSASTFDSEVNDPWTGTSQGMSPADLSTILSGMPLPAIYTTAFDLAQPSGGKVTVLAVNKIMSVSGLPPATISKIINMVVDPTRSRVTKGECSVALALVAMAQKNMNLSIENLTAHREVADEAFLERRLRGLTRFMNALMGHPVLRNDPLVISFLTEPVELALWRKNVVISTEDEFTSQLPISESLAKQVPLDLELQLESIKRRLPASIDYYRSMVHVMDRVQKRTEAAATDYMRFSLAVNALADCEKHCHVEECYNCGQLSQGYSKIGTHISQVSNFLDEQAKATQRGMVEDLKRHRDLLVSVKELLQRRDRLREAGTIETLEKRIAANEAKLKTLTTSAAAAAAGDSSAGEPGTYDAQIERITNHCNSDRAELENQKQRSVLLQHTLWMEITYFHKNHALIATMYQNFVNEQIKTSQNLNDSWKSLSPIVHDLPMEVNGFN
ncbi:Sorting nexin mvp1 [Mortierella sp. AD011]|nr:Sorting nexin mvp1 [Mortierella sp. AD010]KAF9380209.1 Sorting nexin mvp1 [Mortierella sp. AD011]